MLRGTIRCVCRAGRWAKAGAGGRQVEMIVGMGIDIAEIDRIQAAITRHGVPFLERLYTPTEIAYCERE